jgi:trimeric autotransporter adhesin
MSVSFDPKFIKFAKSSGSSLLTGLLGYWKLDATTGTQENDSVGTNHMTVTGATVNATGKLGKALDFTGTSNVASAAYSSSMAFTNDKCTVSLWVKLDTLPSVAGRSYTLFRMEKDTAPGFAVNLRIDYQTNFVGFSVADNTGTIHGNESADNSISSTGTWYHIVGVNVGAGSHAKVFINGTDAWSWTSANFAGTIGPYDMPVHIGNFADSTGNEAPDGIIDEVGVWDRALSDTEVATLYNSGTGITHPF